MERPIISFRNQFQPGVVNKLSYISPYNICETTIWCNHNFKLFMARIVKNGEERGRDKGTLIQEYTDRLKDVELTFNINANLHMTSGDGNYIIDLYVKDENDIWNISTCFFLTNTGQKIKLVDSDYMKVIDTY